MCKNDMNLSLNSDTFSILKDQFDKVLNRTVGNMQMKGADDAVVTLKLSIGLDTESRSTPDGNKDFVIPTFKHDISSVMQVKDKVSGQLVGDYQLVWDEDEQRYVMRTIDNGQTSLYDDEPGDYIETDYVELPATERPALAAGNPDAIEDETEPDDYEYTQPEE